MFQWNACVSFRLIYFLSPNDQQNTAFELNALSAQWKELCEKNIEIRTACAKIENNIEELRREAAERYFLHLFYLHLLSFHWYGA